MDRNEMDIRIFLRFLIFLFGLLSFSVYAEDNPCTGANYLLSLVNRPSILESPCTVPVHQALLEMGYTYEQLRPVGDLNFFPQAVFRVGIPNDFEVDFVAPNYVQLNIDPRAGFTPFLVSLKHLLYIDTKWVASIEAAVIFPSGSYYYGSEYPGAQVNAIASYNINDIWSVVSFLGYSSTSSPRALGGGSFNSINPVIDLVWTKDKLSIYGEVSAQTKSGLYQGGGMNTDLGIIYLLRPYLTIDVEVSHRVFGSYGNFNDYVGGGLAILFG